MKVVIVLACFLALASATWYYGQDDNTYYSYYGGYVGGPGSSGLSSGRTYSRWGHGRFGRSADRWSGPSHGKHEGKMEHKWIPKASSGDHHRSWGSIKSWKGHPHH